MKVRWTRSGVRFRISPTELERLGQGLPVEEELWLPGGQWRAMLAADSVTSLTLEGNVLTLCLAPADREQLGAAEAEGVYFQTTDTPAIRYYVEKDFPCVHPRAAELAEPRSETFAAPDGFAERKA